MKEPITTETLRSLLAEWPCAYTYADLYEHYVVTPAVRPWLARCPMVLCLLAWRGARHADAPVVRMAELLADDARLEAQRIMHDYLEDQPEEDQPDEGKSVDRPVPPALGPEVKSLREAGIYPDDFKLLTGFVEGVKHYNRTQLYLLWAAVQDFWASAWARGKGIEEEHFELLADELARTAKRSPSSDLPSL